MRKILLTSLFLAGIGTLIPAFVSANIQGSYKARVDNSSTQRFFDQVYNSTALTPNQCAGANVSKNYYLPGDYNSDGIKDYGSPLYLRDNFAVVGGTTPTYLIGVRTNGYGGSVVRYQLPSSATNVLRVLNGTQTYDLSSQSAWFRLSKTAPKDVRVRAVESEPMLISAPSTNNINHRSFQVAYQIKYRAFQAAAGGTSDYDVWPVANGGFMGGLSQYSNRWTLKPNRAPIPDRQADYQQTSNFTNTTAIQWNATELVHAYECYNVTTHRCGDGVVDNQSFDNVSASEQCDLGSQNGQPGSACSASCQTVNVFTPGPDVKIIKSVTGSTIQGQNVTYTLSYSNIGSGTANNVVVTDTLEAGLTFVQGSSFPAPSSVVNNANGTTTITWNRGSLAPNAQGVIVFQAQIKMSVPNCSTVVNNVVISASNESNNLLANNSYMVTSPIQCPPIPLNPDVTVIKAVTGSQIQGQNVTYTVTYKNIGSGQANNVVITDTLGTGLTFLPGTSFPPAASVTNNANGTTTITWNVGNIPAGAQGIIVFQAQIKNTVPNCSTVQNKVHVSATNELPADTLNNDYMVTSPIQCPGNPQLQIVKDVVASTGGYVPNGYALYTITYKNIGNTTANGVTVTDTLPSDVTYHTAFPTPTSINGQTLTRSIGNLAAGAQGIIQIYVKINANVPFCQNHTVLNKGTVSATNAPSVEDDATFLVLCYDLRSNKIIDKPVVASGDVVTYTIRYGNNGPLIAPNRSLVDSLPTGMNYIINSATVLSGVQIGQPVVTGNPAAGQTLTWTGFTNMPAGYSGLVQIQARVLGPVASGHVYVNKICIEGDNNYNNNNCGTATTTTTGTTPPTTGTAFFDVNIDKSVNKTVVAFGDNVIYTIVVTNESDVTSPITGYTVNDYLPSGVDYVGTPIGPAGMTTTLSNNNKDIAFGNLPALTPGQSITISFVAKYVSSVNETNYTEVCNYNGVSGVGVKDRDSNPCNRGRTNGVEDDEDQVTIGPQSGPGQSPECQGMSVVSTNPANLSIGNLTTNVGNIAVEYECRTTWGAYPVDAVLDCGNGTQIFTGTTINGNPMKATCNYTNPVTTTARCVVARRPNVNCEVPVKIRSGGGGGRNPYCGDGIYDPSRGEQCDPGNPALGISPSGVPAGKVCRSDCTFTDRPPGMTAQVKCAYVDPPAINVGEYMPYRWDMEYGYNELGANGWNDATFNCSSLPNDTRVNKNTLMCQFVLQGPNGVRRVMDPEPCYSNPGLTLIDTAFNAARLRYNIQVFPGGRNAVQITGANYLGLGEYIIEMKVVYGKNCQGDDITVGNRICQMNFGVTKQYAVSRSTKGTFSSTKDLDTYERQDNTKVLQVSELIKVLEPYTLVASDKTLITQMVNKYVNLAVKASEIDTKLNNNSTVVKATVSKVPGKNIFVIDAKGGTITVLENSNFKDGAFTLIVINGSLTIKGDLTKNPNGMFIVRDGDLTFSAIGDAKENNQNQTVKGIFIGLQNMKAEGDGFQPAFNNNLNKPWINGGRLMINGIILGGDLSKLVTGRRSVVENWFDRRAGDGLLEDGSIVIKANPEIFTSLPPGAEDIALTLNVFKN